MPILYIVATPIGNLGDISQRAINTLKTSDLILCEDTRVTRTLLNSFEVKAEAISYHQHTSQEKINALLEFSRQGKVLSLVSDAGTPGISDPGNKFIEEFLKAFGTEAQIIPIPGPSALATLASIAGFAMDKFIFFGFPPHKNKRQKYFQELLSFEYPVIFYESCHRIIKSLEDIEKNNKEVSVVVGRELTKKFESVYRGTISEVIAKVKKDPLKGEYTVIIKK